MALFTVFNCIFTRNFVSVTTFWNLLVQSTTILMLAMGMTLVIATGGIDISVGSTMALSAIVLALCVSKGHIAAGVILAVLLAAAGGLFAGTLVARFRILPMVATLSLQYMLRGIAKVVVDGYRISCMNDAFTGFARIRIGGVVPIQVLIIVLTVAVMYIVVNRMSFGAKLEAYGNNPAAARISGINTMALCTFCFVLCSIFASFAGILETARVTSCDPATMGYQLETDAIAAVVVGGTPVTGGKPNILGTFCGAVLLQMVTIMVNMHNITYSYSLMIKTVIIVAAVYLHRRGHR
nr:ABC transporter permease [Lientehia hominis]